MRAEYHAKKIPSYIVQSYVVPLSYSHVHLTLVSDSANKSFEDINVTGNSLENPKYQYNADNHSTSTVAVSTCQYYPSTRNLSSKHDTTLFSPNTLVNLLESQFRSMSTTEKGPYKHRLQSIVA